MLSLSAKLLTFGKHFSQVKSPDSTELIPARSFLHDRAIFFKIQRWKVSGRFRET